MIKFTITLLALASLFFLFARQGESMDEEANPVATSPGTVPGAIATGSIPGGTVPGVVATRSSLHTIENRSQHEDLSNFQQVNPQLYRGAQPPKESLKKLQALGIKTIVNLRGESEGTREEEKAALALGLKFYNVPLPPLSRPNDEQINKALALLNDPANAPVFVHCKHGEDRTGTVIACYRITHDGWNLAATLAEVKKFGMSRMQVGMKNYVKDYYRRFSRAKP